MGQIGEMQTQWQNQRHGQLWPHIASQHYFEGDVPGFRGVGGINNLSAGQKGAKIPSQPVNESEYVEKL